jgi:hypothetical protein
MQYPFPDLRACCLVCGASGCAVYRGYYTRLLFCPEMEFIGRIAIRTGYCKRTDSRFALLPDFLIYRRRISRISYLRLWEDSRSVSARLRDVIDELITGLPDEYWLPISTAYSYLKLHTLMPP